MVEMDREFWEDARKKSAVCWGVGKEDQPCEQCRSRTKKKGRIGCGEDCGCGCGGAMKGATLGLHEKSEREAAYELAIKAYTHARAAQTEQARAWALGYLQAIADLAVQEGHPEFAKDIEAISHRL